tara:strand:- start:47 stop:550 length:504 start_codon:yes stop_codon:yes gene_type:complete
MIKKFFPSLAFFLLFSCAIAPPTYISELDDGEVMKNKVFVIRDTGASDKRSMVDVKLNDMIFGSIHPTEVIFTNINQFNNTITSSYTNNKNAKCKDMSINFDAKSDESYYFIVFNSAPHSRLPACLQMYQTDLANFQKTRIKAKTRIESNTEAVITSFIEEVILGLP